MFTRSVIVYELVDRFKNGRVYLNALYFGCEDLITRKQFFTAFLIYFIYFSLFQIEELITESVQSFNGALH